MSKKVQVEVKGRKWDINSLKELLLKNDKAVMKAVSLIYSFQTCEEQYSNNTKNFYKIPTKKIPI